VLEVLGVQRVLDVQVLEALRLLGVREVRLAGAAVKAAD
jgi:hypothetical protein